MFTLFALIVVIIIALVVTVVAIGCGIVFMVPVLDVGLAIFALWLIFRRRNKN